MRFLRNSGCIVLIIIILFVLLLVATFGTVVYGYSQMEVDFVAQEYSPEIEISTSSIISTIFDIFKGDLLSAAANIIKGMKIEGTVNFSNASFVPLYIPAMRHQVAIEGKECRQVIETEATWVGPNSYESQYISLLIGIHDLPEIALTILAQGGTINVEIVSEIPLGAFSVTKTTSEQRSVTNSLSSYTRSAPTVTTPAPTTPTPVTPAPPADNPPYTPSNPSPPDHASGVSVDTILSWTGGDPDPGDTVLYDIYFGYSSSDLNCVSRGLRATSYNPDTLSPGTEYYWGIRAYDSNGNETYSPVALKFTTESISAPSSVRLITDTINLAVLDEAALEEYFVTYGYPSKFPFRRYGVFYSKLLSLNENDAVDITLRSNTRVCVDGTSHDCEDSLLAFVWLYKSPGNISTKEVRIVSCEVHKLESAWETRVTFSAQSTGSYQLGIANFWREPTWCEYTMSIR